MLALFQPGEFAAYGESSQWRTIDLIARFAGKRHGSEQYFEPGMTTVYLTHPDTLLTTCPITRSTPGA
jgi:hypothetical protein